MIALNDKIVIDAYRFHLWPTPSENPRTIPVACAFIYSFSRLDIRRHKVGEL